MKLNQKSQGASITLILLFGPFGLFYSSSLAAIIVTILMVLTFSTGFLPLLLWLISFGIGAACTSSHNDEVTRNVLMLTNSNGNAIPPPMPRQSFKLSK